MNTVIYNPVTIALILPRDGAWRVAILTVAAASTLYPRPLPVYRPKFNHNSAIIITDQIIVFETCNPFSPLY